LGVKCHRMKFAVFGNYGEDCSKGVDDANRPLCMKYTQ